jgi:hypothetical protein
MNHTTLIFIVFSFLVGILVVAIWSNTRVFAQQLPSLYSSAPPAGNRSDSSSSPSNPISPQLKAKMCDPSNPSLKVVNTTESRICGIPKTLKPSLLSSAAAPPTSSTVSSSSPPQQQTTTTTKPTTAAANAATTTPKQQQIKSTNNNNTNAISRPTTSGVDGTKIAPVSNPGNKSLSSTSPTSSAIAPQIKAINQQQQRQPITRINDTTTGINNTTTGINNTAPPIKAVDEQQQQPPAPSSNLINGTAGQNYTFVASSPTLPSGKLLYLGYHDDDSSPTNGYRGPKEKSSSDSEPSIDRSSSTTSDNDSIEKKKEKTSSSAKLDRADSTNDESSSSKDKGSSFDAKPSSPPYIKITAPDNDASSKKSNKKTTSSTKLDRADNTIDDDAKSIIDLITGSVSDGGSIENKKTSSSAKLDRADSTNDESSSSKDKISSDSKPSIPHIKITAPDNDSVEKNKKKTSSSAKLDRADSTNDESSSSKKDKSSSFDSRSSRHTNDGRDSSSSSDLASATGIKVDSTIRNSLGGAGHNLFGFSDHGF